MSDVAKSLTCSHASGPEGYIQRMNWLERMSKRYKQMQCDNCGLWAIWKRPRAGISKEGVKGNDN